MKHGACRPPGARPPERHVRPHAPDRRPPHHRQRSRASAPPRPSGTSAQRHGVTMQELTADEARKLVPALTGQFARAFFAPEYWTVSSPLAILEALRRRIGDADAFVKQEVIALHPAEPRGLGDDRRGRRPAVRPGRGRRRRLVARPGARPRPEGRASRPSAATTPPIPKRADRPADAGLLRRSRLRRLAARRRAPRRRRGRDWPSLDAPPNFARAAAMRKKMRRYVPDLPEEGGARMDGLPAVDAGFAAGHRRPPARSAHRLRLRPRPSRPDAVGRHRPPRRRADRRPAATRRSSRSASSASSSLGPRYSPAASSPHRHAQDLLLHRRPHLRQSGPRRRRRRPAARRRDHEREAPALHRATTTGSAPA